MPDPTTKYAEAVLAGDIIAGPHVRASCRRHMKDLKRKDIFFDVDAADYALGFFPSVLRLNGGNFEGEPFVLAPPQEFIVGSIFGWKRLDGTRRFRRAYLEIGKGNGKSPLAAGIGLFMMLADGEARAEIYAAAAKKRQAFVLFKDAVRMVEQSPALSARLHLSGGFKTNNIADLETGSNFEPISREEGKTGSGPRPSCALCDEVHEIPNRDVIDMLERGFKFRKQPLLLMTTNSGSDPNTVCGEEHAHAVAVAHGHQAGETTFSYVCALDEGDDPLIDPSCWIKANPLLGVILEEDYLRDIAAAALEIPGSLNSIMRLHFCCWTDSETAWISTQAVIDCEDDNLRREDFLGKRFWAGLDLSATKDMTARIDVFEDGMTEATIDADGEPVAPQMKYAVFCHAYVPRDTMIERDRMEKSTFEVWARQGHLIALPGKKIRYDYLVRDLIEAAQDYDCEAVVYDRFLINRFEDELEEAGATFALMEHPQGFNHRKGSDLWMPGSIDMLETLILEKRIRFEVNPVLRSAISSTTFIESPAGLRRFVKPKSGNRIDCAVALAMAIGGATGGAEADTGAVTIPADYRITA